MMYKSNPAANPTPPIIKPISASPLDVPMPIHTVKKKHPANIQPEQLKDLFFILLFI